MKKQTLSEKQAFRFLMENKMSDRLTNIMFLSGISVAFYTLLTLYLPL